MHWWYCANTPLRNATVFLLPERHECRSFPSTANLLDPPDRLDIADLAQIPLGGRQVRMPQDDLADNLQRSTRSRGIGGRVAFEVMWPYMQSNQTTGIDHHIPDGGIVDREYPLVRTVAFLLDIGFEPIGDLLGNVNDLALFSAFGAYNLQPALPRCPSPAV